MTLGTKNLVTWEDFLAQARTSSDQERSESYLTAILAAALNLSPESLHERRVGGFPPGVPAKGTVRNAAQLLLDLTEGPRSKHSSARRSLAWTQLLRLPQHEVLSDLSPDGEVLQSLENCQHALSELGEDGDPVDRAIVLLQIARFQRRSNRAEEAIKTLTQCTYLYGSVRLIDTPRILQDAPFLRHFITSKIDFKYAEIICNAHKDLGAFDESMRQVTIAREHASRYVDANLSNWLRTWIIEGDIHRRKRDVKNMIRVENHTKKLVEQYPQSPEVARLHSALASENASLFQDLSRAQAFRYQRLRDRLFEDLAREFDGAPSIEDLMGCVEHYRELNSKAGITWLGNTAHAIASGHVRSGDTLADPQIRQYVAGLLDVSEAAWEGFATNGVSSLLFSRARLALMSGDIPTDELTTDLLTASRKAYRSWTAENALRTAVQYGIVGSADVRERLNEKLLEFDPEKSYVMHAKTRGLLAEWWWRTVNSARPAAVDWKHVQTEALAAAQMLRHEGVSLDPELEAVAWMTAARALAETAPSTSDEQLRLLLSGARCVTELMLTIATALDRQRVARKFHSLFHHAADLAIALGDHEAADLIMEAARRDRVGLLLAELARNPEIDSDIRTAALAVQDSGSTIADPARKASNGDSDDESGVRGRSSVIAVDRAAAVKAAESVLGPLSALADPRHLDTATAAIVLERRVPSMVPTVILQLLPLASDTVSDSPWVKMLRRVTIDTPGIQVQQFTDSVDLPRLYLNLEPGSDNIFEWRESYTHLLLPPPLIDLLTVTSVTAPIRLMIVPTGFFHIPFDALPVTRDTHVLDHALISLHGSLTSVLSLMELDDQRIPTPALAVYDESLTHALPELDALLTALDGVHPIRSLQELNSEMTVNGTQSHSLLAMAVHGSADETGWGQAKKLHDADGNEVWITAAQALSWTVPRLCVLASCNTPIAAADGIEVGGFPLALMLRGASTVIGGLYNIDDKATSDIMIVFWRRLAAGDHSLDSLRHAKLDYLSRNPDARQIWPEYWSGLTAYGAATI